MSELTTWLLLNRILVVGISSIIVATVVYLSNRDTINLYLKTLYYRLPLIGKNARLSKRLELDDQRWFNSEREVCNSFLPFYDQYNADEYHYEQSSRYLNKIGDTGISPMKWYTWLGLSIMVLIEAAGFAYVLAGFTIQDGSESIQIQAAVGIALLISVLLVGFTHAMGGELYRNQQIGKVRLHWNHDPQKPGVIAPDLNIGLKSKTNALDDNQPSWRQMANRLAKTNAGFSKSWAMSIVTVVFISIVAVGATYVRGQVLEKLAIEEISGHEQEGMGSAFDIQDPFAESAPAELTAYNDEAENKAFRDAINAHKRGGWMTFIMLAVIFAAMQAYSIYLGFKTTFSGKESPAAYDATYKFSNVNAYIEYYVAQQANVERAAQSVLSHLQSKIAINAQRSAGEQHVIYAANNPSSRNFLNYYKLRALKNAETPELIKTQYPDYQPAQQAAPQPMVQPTAQSAVEPVYQPVPQPEVASTTESFLSDVDIINKVKNNDLDGLTDEQVIAALKAISNEPKPETAEERLARLQKQAMTS
ncbi:hypothetical protein [Photobacterium sp. TLY01]|uniref:hypothetical protein n=1 Tax=Photobacterium sp. TLY01 TaxID=2907534 RepID=UPI001F483A51|nr:hypothetical protein [Photobacterium sp. TLY01]UIP30484.1 hypothetical protein LN341_17360 [Photobacterium sp. TLY01]